MLITGATGTLGRAFAHICQIRGIACRLLSRAEMDIADATSVKKVLDELKPWAVINAAGYERVDDAEHDADSCYRDNTMGPVLLAQHCHERDIRLLTFSSDLVFDGNSKVPYLEKDELRPLGIYGLSKKQAEKQISRIYPEALIIRTSAFFSPWDNYNFVTQTINAALEEREFFSISDCVITPTYVPDLVHNCLDLLMDGENGIWNLANSTALTWENLAKQALRIAGLSDKKLKSAPVEKFNYAARRPRYSALGSSRGVLLPSLENSLER